MCFSKGVKNLDFLQRKGSWDFETKQRFFKAYFCLRIIPVTNLLMSDINVLYIDDEEVNLFIFEASFKEKFNIITAGNGPDGLELLGANPKIDVVISDMKMPIMDGVEFISIAKKQYPDKKYFILTAFDNHPDVLRAEQDGLIHKFFTKPFEINEIHNFLNMAVGAA